MLQILIFFLKNLHFSNMYLKDKKFKFSNFLLKKFVPISMKASFQLLCEIEELFMH